MRTPASYNYLFGEAPTLADLSAELRTAWTADTLYFAASIQDDVLVGNNSTQIWGDDVIELSVYVPSTVQTHLFTLAVDGRKTDNGVPISALSMVTRTIPGGWALEAAVPASALGLSGFAAGERYPFTFGLWDDDLRHLPWADPHDLAGQFCQHLQAGLGRPGAQQRVLRFPCAQLTTSADHFHRS